MFVIWIVVIIRVLRGRLVSLHVKQIVTALTALRAAHKLFVLTLLA